MWSYPKTTKWKAEHAYFACCQSEWHTTSNAVRLHLLALSCLHWVTCKFIGERSHQNRFQLIFLFLFSIFYYYFPLLFFTPEGFTIFLQLFGKMLMGQCNQIKYVNFLMNNHIGILLSSNKLGDFHKSYTMQWFFSLWLSTWRGFLLDITVYQ